MFEDLELLRLGTQLIKILRSGMHIEVLELLRLETQLKYSSDLDLLLLKSRRYSEMLLIHDLEDSVLR